MKNIINRWPLILFLVGMALIALFFVQSWQKNQIGEVAQLPPSATRLLQTAATLPTNTLTPTAPPSPTPTTALTPSVAPTTFVQGTAVSDTAIPPTAVPLTTTAISTTAVPATPILRTAVSTTASPTAELPPIINASPTPTNALQPPADPQPTATPGFLTVTPPPTGCSPAVCIHRFGVSGHLAMISAAYSVGLPFGSYFNWELENDPLSIGQATFWQMIRVSEAGIRHDWSEIAQAVEANPGANWIVGNEPDILWQDNTTPQQYAHIYHDVYSFIKERDPSAKIAVAGVGQPTPLRMAYLDLILQIYQQSYGQPMPVDIWTIHNFILREERDSWGIGIPPGMIDQSGQPINQGILYEIEDHADLNIFKENLINFRQWLADRGYRDRPLALTEFGILMPTDFGFPPQAVAHFMTETFAYLTQASVVTTGYMPDGNRLVQWSFWYSVYDSQEFPTGNLYDPETGDLTLLGKTYADYINGG